MKRNDGIGDAIYLIDIIDETDENDDPLAGMKRRLDVGGNGNQELQSEDLVPIEITSVVSIEVGDNDDLEVINKDDSLSNVTLVEGDMVTFTSLSQQLDHDESLEDQYIDDVLPGGVSIIIEGKNAGGEMVKNRVFWTYTNDCRDFLLIEVGDTIGWLTFVSHMIVRFFCLFVLLSFFWCVVDTWCTCGFLAVRFSLVGLLFYECQV